MRSDMFEIIIERPRRNGHWVHEPKGRLKEFESVNIEHSPRLEPMSRGRGSKSLNENLAPLLRFLERSVGKPWNKVHSEIAEHLSMNSAVQKHVLDHVKDFVELNPVMIDGKPHNPVASGPKRNHYRALYCYRTRGGYYVCPKTGFLKKAPILERQRPPDANTADRKSLGNLLEARKIEGVWYLIELAKVPSTWKEWPQCYDALAKGRLSEPGMMSWNGTLMKLHGRSDRYALSKRQLSKKEIRMYGLNLLS